MDPSRIVINNHVFSRYECEVACAIQLYIRNANNQKPSDETLGFIIKSLRGEVNGVPLPCANMVYNIEHDVSEPVRAIYLSVCCNISVSSTLLKRSQVYCNRDYWYPEARKVWYAWLAQNDALVRRSADCHTNPFFVADLVGRLHAQGTLAPFLNRDGTLKTNG